MAQGMSRKQLLELPVTVDVQTAAKALGIGRNLAYDLLTRGEFPCRTQKLGSRIRVITGGPDGLVDYLTRPADDSSDRAAPAA